MSISAIILRNEIHINKCVQSYPLKTAIQIMAEENVNGLAVIDKLGKLTGIITGHDVVKALSDDNFVMENAHVHQYMSTHVITCHRDTNLSSALLTMKKHDIQHLVIIDDDELVAVLSMKDILAKMHQNDIMELSVLKDIAVAHKVATVN